jgi:LuxR family maltose regulon positive regulatory protein
VGRRGLAAEDQPGFAREREYLTLARLLVAERKPDRALPLLARLEGLAVAQGRVGSLIEVRVVQALALAAGGEETGALEALGEALTLAWPEGYVRVVVDEGAPMAALLGRVMTAAQARPALAGGIPLTHLRRLRDASDRHPPSTAPQPGHPARVVPGLVDPLSDRELEVLGLLAAGRANRQIADQLVVALDTVKKHVSHILDKLGASNRTQAVARARELGLLP